MQILLFLAFLQALLGATPLMSLDSDGAVTRARDKATQLFIMLVNEYDHACTLATPLFRKLHHEWSDGVAKPNVTFALADSERTPSLARAILGEKGNVPAYMLYIKGIATPVMYRGGWSEKSLGAWLHKQSAMQPTEVSTVKALRETVRASVHGLALVGFLTEAQRGRRLLEVAARTAQAPAPVVLGDAALATALGTSLAKEPCILVVRRDSTSWPLLGGALLQRTVEAFASERAMPSLIAMGDKRGRDFSRLVRHHPLQLHVMLMHRSGEQGPHEPSDDALYAMGRVAARYDRSALFLSYDFFDNDPDAFTAVKAAHSDLPVVLAIHGRGGFSERIWRMSPDKGGEFGTISEEDIEQLVERALGEVGNAAGKLTAREQQNLFEAPEDFWEQSDGGVSVPEREPWPERDEL